MTLAPATPSAAVARRVVRETVSAELPAETAETVELLTSELVANAVAGTGDPCVLALSVPHPGVLRVEVGDSSPAWGTAGLPYERRERGVLPPDPMAEGGRGLLLVALLSRCWGVAPCPTGGKVVWFEVAL
ncbi:MAG TPA: ATP-binding protein [Egibacteraceae bacterium]|nr:ATP-binding protein [Egibacteraceae bacterium]